MAASFSHADMPATPDRITLVLGGARSGKSRLAETLARRSNLSPVYIATAEAGDDEMAERIARHQADRGPEWTNIEEPLALANAVVKNTSTDRILLIDCLTLWLSNLMHANTNVPEAVVELTTVLGKTAGPVIVVSNEVGLGIVPENQLARAFRDHAGRCHQSIAAIADTVIFCAAGLPLVLKKQGQPINPEYAF